jgi:phosphoglycerol transferase MdoB-like AlkP superfamily enzyme
MGDGGSFGWSDFMMSHRYAFALDLSMTAYILALPAFWIIGCLFIGKEPNINRPALRWYFLLIVLLSTIIFISDLGLFAEWGSKLNRKAMAYASDIDKVLISAQSTPLLLLLSILLITLFLSHWILKRLLAEQVKVNAKLPTKLRYSIVLLAGIFIAIRGGLQPLPIKKNWSYFSKHNVLNLAAVNSTWNCMELLVRTDKLAKNPYLYFSKEEAHRIFDSLHQKNRDRPISISKTDRPNILMILLESWSGDVIGATGGEQGVTPGFTALCKDGLLFPNFYSTGFRTEQGQAALFGGFPAQPTTTVMQDFQKFDKLPGLAKVLGQNGYYSSFYYTGDLDFANTGKYLFSAGFDKIIGEQNTDFEDKTLWGAMDEELFGYHLRQVKDDVKPFFSVLMTSTSHEPFEAKVPQVFESDDPADLYRNTVHYTDAAVSDYLEKAKATDWYENTLIIIVSDHAHHLPYRRERHDPERHHIPFLITGGSLKDEFRGSEIQSIASHVDFCATILSQLGIASDEFKYSKDMFAANPADFACYTFEDGFGWIDSSGTIVYDHQLGKVILESETEEAPDLSKGKAYVQELMQDYIDF